MSARLVLPVSRLALLGGVLIGCSGEAPAERAQPTERATEAPMGSRAPVLETTTAPTEGVTAPLTTTTPPTTPTTTAREASPDALAPCLWYAAREAPPTSGLGSLEDLDERIAASQPDRIARVVGRVRLAARGCPSLSVGIALLAHENDDVDDEDLLPITGRLATPAAGARGDERRNGPWVDGAIEEGASACVEDAMPTLVLFRATHTGDGAVQTLAFQALGEVCAVLGHDLSFGDMDDDHTTEVRLRTRTSGLMDMSAGRDRGETLRIVDVARWHVQVELEVATLEEAEVDGYGGRTREGDITLRDLDADGDRDLVFTHRDEDRMRSADDEDEESFRSSAHEAYVYDAPTDVYQRTATLDPHAPQKP